MKKLKIHRESLYSEVWTKPISKLAQKYGLSDVGLKKICNALKVPTPPRGYWAKIQNNIEAEKTPLPPIKEGQPTVYGIQKHSLIDGKFDINSNILSEEAARLIQKFQLKTSPRVLKRFSSTSPLVLKSRKFLANSETNKYGLLIGEWDKKHLDIRVSPNLLSRALRIMEAIVRFFDSAGIQVQAESGGQNTSITLFGKKVSFFIRELSNQHDHVLTKKEKVEQKRYGYAYFHKYDYIPSGKLKLEIDDYGTDGIRKRWSDGKKQRVEDFLHEFAINVVKIADINRTREIEWEQQRQRRDLERQRRTELERLRKMEEQRLQDLENQAESWIKSLSLHSYIEAVEKKISKMTLSEVSHVKFAQWLKWAKAHADRLNPLLGRFPIEDFSGD